MNVQKWGKHLLRYTDDDSVEVTFIDNKKGEAFTVVYDTETMSYYTETEDAFSDSVELNYNLFLGKIIQLENVVSLDEFVAEKEPVNGIFYLHNRRSNKIYISYVTNIENLEEKVFELLEYGDHYNKHLQNSYNKNGREAFTFELAYTDLPDVESFFGERLKEEKRKVAKGLVDYTLFNYDY